MTGSRVIARGPAGASVTVDARLDGPRRYTVDLTLIGGRWFVSDVHSPALPSLLSHLRREVLRAERL